MMPRATYGQNDNPDMRWEHLSCMREKDQNEYLLFT
jgi:hypothetical protein